MNDTAGAISTVHVLIVDDDEKMRPLYERFLFEDDSLAPHGFEPRFHWATRGGQAVETAARLVAEGESVGCALIDYLLDPHCDGIDTILNIWQHDPRAHCTLVTAARYLDEEETLARIPEPFRARWDFIAKPFTRLEITQRVRRSLASFRSLRNERRHAANNARLLEVLAEKNIALEDDLKQFASDVADQNHRLEQKNLDLERAMRDLERAQSLLVRQEKMACIGQLAAGVAHELNNPIGFVHSNLGTLQRYCDKIRVSVTALRENEGEEAERVCKEQRLDFVLQDLPQLTAESLDGTERVSKIVQDLKLFSHSDEDAHDADLNECVRSALNIVHNEIKYKATISSELAELPPVWCIPGQINQVILNLVLNAAQAIETNGEIRVVTRRDGPWVAIDVADNGCGMSEAVRASVFDPFFTTKPAGKGTGLGLSITFDIIAKHGGEIDVESEPGAGTTFHVRLPVETGGAA